MSDPSNVGRVSRSEDEDTVHRTTDRDTVTRRYRRGVGGWWWLGLLAIPLLLALLGRGFGDTDANNISATTGTNTSSGATAGATGANAGLPSPFSLTRSGDSITVAAQVPDDAAKSALIDAVKATAGGATVVDQVTVAAGSTGPDLAALGGVLGATADIPDYGVKLDGSTLALTGTAPTDTVKAGLETAAKAAFPSATVDNQVTVGAGTGAPAGALPPFSVVPDGDTVVVTAEVPDDAAKTALLDAVKAGSGKATVVDKVTVKAGAIGPDPATLATLLGGLGVVPDAGVTSDGTALTLTGTAADDATKAAAGTAAQTAYPAATVTNNISVKAATPAPPASAAGCDGLNAAITAITAKSRIAFTPGSATLTRSSVTTLRSVATRIKACATAKVTVAGHTDSTAPGDGKPLSLRRANAVKAALVAGGVKAGSITAVGYGETKPIASNSTPAGMAQNRRVEITVN